MCFPKNHFMTASGLAVNPLDFKPEDILLSDVGRALSNTCRWGGHLPPGVWISVAQHSVWVLRLLQFIGIKDHKILTQGLLHDASEAYVGDMVAPFKGQMPLYEDIEKHVQKTIADAYHIGYPFDPIVHWADKAAMVVVEAERAGKVPVPDVFSSYLENALTTTVWVEARIPNRGLFAFLGDDYYLWGPAKSYSMFMSSAKELGVLV